MMTKSILQLMPLDGEIEDDNLKDIDKYKDDDEYESGSDYDRYDRRRSNK